MNEKYKITSKIEDNEIELFERLKMCLMLNELLNKNKGKYFKYEWKTVISYISEPELRQICFAYIQVVLDTLKNFEDDVYYRNYILEINKILNFNLGVNTVGEKIFDFRNKTFHPQNKSFLNTKELYSVYFDGFIEKCEEIINVFEKIFYKLVRNKNKMISAVFNFYKTNYYKKIKKEGENLE